MAVEKGSHHQCPPSNDSAPVTFALETLSKSFFTPRHKGTPSRSDNDVGAISSGRGGRRSRNGGTKRAPRERPSPPGWWRGGSDVLVGRQMSSSRARRAGAPNLGSAAPRARGDPGRESVLLAAPSVPKDVRTGSIRGRASNRSERNLRNSVQTCRKFFFSFGQFQREETHQRVWKSSKKRKKKKQDGRFCKAGTRRATN